MLKCLTNQLNDDASAGNNQKLTASFLTFQKEDSAYHQPFKRQSHKIVKHTQTIRRVNNL